MILPSAETRRSSPRLRLLFGVLVAACSLAGVAPAFAQTPDTTPLEAYRGSRLLVEYPSLDDVGRKIDPPKGWKYLQVSAEIYDALLGYLDADRSPEAFLFFDEFGNFVHREQSRDRLGRLERGYEEVEKKIAAWKRRLKKDSTSLADARRQGRDERELELLVSIAETKLEGYPEVIGARARLKELELLRLVELWEVLASEGIVRRRALASALSSLHDRSKGLSIARVIEAEFDRVEAGHVTHDKRPRPAGE